jgi:hypothetical protein
MQAKTWDGELRTVTGLTQDEAITAATEALKDPEVASATVHKDPSSDMNLNRHERRAWRHEDKVYARASRQKPRKKKRR